MTSLRVRVFLAVSGVLLVLPLLILLDGPKVDATVVGDGLVARPCSASPP